MGFVINDISRFRSCLFPKLLLTCLANLIFYASYCQINKNGLPLIKNYTADDYKAHNQNWAIFKDNRGVMYFANNFGLLQFDGAKWKLYSNKHIPELRSLAVDGNGTIFYGSSQDYGIISLDSLGTLRYKSIYKKYNPGDADFNVVWNIKTFADYVVFQSNQKIFRLKIPFNPDSVEDIKKKMTVFIPEKAFHWSFNVYGKFYVREYEKGLFVLENDKLILIPGGEIFANQKVYVMLPYGNGKILICSREGGIYIYDPYLKENAISKLDCKANKVLIESIIYGGVVLQDNKFAFSTLANGIIIIDNKGNIIEHLNKSSGLPDEMIYYTFYDKLTGLLWFTSAENGIFKTAIGSPFREWNKKNGLDGVVVDIERVGNKIYAATDKGVYFMDETVEGYCEFKLIPEISFEVWDLQTFKSDTFLNDRLLAATIDGVFEIKGNKAIKIDGNGYVLQLKQSVADPSKLLVGYADGFGLLELNQFKKWNFIERNKAINNKSIISIFEKSNGELYLGASGSGFLKLKNFEDNEPLVIDSTQGLILEGQEFKVYQIDNEIVFATQSGLFVYDEKENKVKPYLKFGNDLSGGNTGVYNILKTENQYWLSIYSNDINEIWYDLIKLKPKGNKFVKEEKFSRIIPQKLPLALYNDGNFLWIANEKGLYKYDKNYLKDYSKPYYINISKVTLGEDSVIFKGSFFAYKKDAVHISIYQPEHLKPKIDYHINDITIEYIASFYEAEDQVEYSYRLIGAKDNWSKWTNQTKIRLFGLSPKTYLLQIRARNIYGKISQITNYEFSILPPWYRTNIAYLIYFILTLISIWIVIQYNLRKLKLDKLKLEGVVAERTAEIRDKNIELENQKEEIIAQRDEIITQRDELEDQRNLLINQKNKIEMQQKNITDSITYARKIQEALLPPVQMLDEFLPEHFVFWKPRDIVSGDFYWASKKDNKTYLVAADCTGHGVPGAFMSMMGISYLNEIMNKFEDISANEILNELRASVKSALRQTGKVNETKDGMDMSLLIMDFEKMEMEFAGAYNSLLLIRDEAIIKYKADRMPIGIYFKELNSFTNHVIEMKKGDNYYIHSDGYVDQFGGDKGLKIMIKRFEEILLKNHQKPAIEQKVALELFLDKWLSFTGNDGEKYQQLDDILVIGIRI